MRKIAAQLIVSSVALALMAAGGGFHWWKVKEMQTSVAGPDWISLAVEESPSGWAMLTSIGPRKQEAEEKEMPTRAEMNTTLQALEGVVDVLRDLKVENSSLRDQNSDLLEQVMELHRDVNELQLRADSVSESFRPLKSKESTEGIIQSTHPLLPQKRRPSTPTHPLLPPKPTGE